VSIELTTAPSVEPVDADELKTHLRYDSSDLDDYLATLATAARKAIELWEWRAHVTQTWTMRLDAFPSDNGPIYVPRPPLQSVTSIQYVDADGETQTCSADDYDVDGKAEPGRVQPGYGKVWPTTRAEQNAVTMVYVAGYGDAAADVPAETKHAIKLFGELLFRSPGISVAGAQRESPALAALLKPCRDERVLEFA